MTEVRRVRKGIFEFRCPECKEKVRRLGNAYVCSACSARWPIYNGIPCFNTRPFYWAQVPKSKMKKLIEIAKAESWKVALERILLPVTDEYTFNYAVDESRADWHFMLPVKGSSRVLDVGCGWGSTTIPLARYYDMVWADLTLKTLCSTKIPKA